MKLFGAIIVNSNNINITILDAGNTEILEADVSHQASDVIAALAPHRRDLESIVMEASEDPAWLIEALEAEGYRNIHTLD